MGTLLFIVMWLFTDHKAANDYQVLPLIVSLDAISATLLLTLLQLRKGKKQESGSGE